MVGLSVSSRIRDGSLWLNFKILVVKLALEIKHYWKTSVLYNGVPLEKYLSWLISGNLSSPKVPSSSSKVSVSSKGSSSSPSAISRISSYTTSDSSVHMSLDSAYLEMEQSLSA